MVNPNKPPTNSGDLSSCDLAILRHVGLYRLTFTHPVQRLFFPADEFGGPQRALERAGNALHGLASADMLTSTSAKLPLRFNKDYRYWILTPAGCKRIGVRSKRAKPTSEPNNDLAILWACTMDMKRFHRLTLDEVKELFPDKPPHQLLTHAISEQEDDQRNPVPIIYRLCPTVAEPKQVLRQAKGYYEDTLKNESLRPLVEVGDYGFAILVSTEQWRKEVQKELSKSDGEKTSMTRLARFTVRLGPRQETLREAIKGLNP